MEFSKDQPAEISDFKIKKNLEVDIQIDSLDDYSTRAEEDFSKQHMLEIQEYRSCRTCLSSIGALMAPCKC